MLARNRARVERRKDLDLDIIELGVFDAPPAAPIASARHDHFSAVPVTPSNLAGPLTHRASRHAWKGITAALVAQVLACAPLLPCETCPRETARVSVDLCVDDAFSYADRMAIWRAADRWTRAFCGMVTIDPRIISEGDTRGCDRSLLRVESGYEWVMLKMPCDGNHCVAGWTNEVRDTAWIIRDLVPEGALETVAAHELGHLLNIDEGQGLMDPYLTDGCIDRSAVVQGLLGVCQ